MKRLPIKLLSLILLSAGWLTSAGAARVAPPDSSAALTESALIRGLEADPVIRGGRLRTGANALLWLPRTVLDRSLLLIARSAYVADESGLAEHIESLLSFGGGYLGWYPVVNISSGSKTAAGATLYYDKDPLRFSLGGRYRNHEIWTATARLGATFDAAGRDCEAELTGRLRHRDDYRFYGFGSDPGSDPRNIFAAGAAHDYGVFAQRISRLDLVVDVRLSSHWILRGSSLLRRREVLDPDAAASDNLSAVFAPGLPGVGVGKQAYNEIAMIHDTRPCADRITPGTRLEIHAGLSDGFDGDPSRFSRAGIDAAHYLPVIGHDRVLVPRLILDTIDNRNDAAPVSFADYPRQRTYRGISNARLLRTDAVSLTPSLEYQWPLTYRLNAHLFWETLLVAGKIGDLESGGAPWAMGLGLDLQASTAELARLSIAGGSDGLRIIFSYGFSKRTNTRTKWQ